MPIARDARLSNVLGAFSTAVVDKMEAAFASEGRGDRAAAALVQIGAEPGLPIETLRRYLGLSHSACVRLVDQLEMNNLVNRRSTKGGDRRVRSLLLTADGEKAARAHLKARATVLDRALARLTGAEKEQLAALIDRMMPAVVIPGDDGDVVCRHCDLRACPTADCPVERCRPPAPTAN